MLDAEEYPDVDGTPTGSPSRLAGVWRGGAEGGGEEGRGEEGGGGEDGGNGYSTLNERYFEDAGGLDDVSSRLSKVQVYPATGKGEGGVEGVDAAEAEEIAAQRKDTFNGTMQLAEDLCGLSARLAAVFPQEGRQGALRQGITKVSEGLMRGHRPGAGVMFPMGDVVGRCRLTPA